MREFYEEIQSLHDANLYRNACVYGTQNGATIRQDGRTFLNFTSNDYLGLAHHERLKEAAHRAIDEYGVGSTASRLVTGTTGAHQQLEETIATLKATEAAVVFSNGYATALGGIPAICGKEDTIILDKLCHACLIDGARASGARLRVFPHNKIDRLESLLISERERLPDSGRLMIMTESVFSMDGDLAPLAEIVELKEKYGALLLLDEAHGLGVLGQRGLGLAEELGLQSKVELQMGTLGKAAGVAGGYIACSQTIRELIVNKARAFIFSTAPPPMQCAAAEEALKMISSEIGEARRGQLRKHQETMNQSGVFSRGSSAIFPYILGGNEKALTASAFLKERGFLVPAIRYPTVPKNEARLRVSLSAVHDDADIVRLCETMRDFLAQLS